MRKLIPIFLIFLSVEAPAQDIHFSQFEQAPLNLNPALTGQFDGNIRAVLNHRSQWASLTDPFVTSALSVDTRLFTSRLPNDNVSIGLLLLTDQSGVANLNYTKVMFSGSYSRNIAKKGFHVFGVGLQGGFFQRNIDQTKLIFESQFQDNDFDPAQNSGEQFGDLNAMKSDLQAGLMYFHRVRDEYKIRAGASIFHLLNPNESLINGDSRLSLREVIHGSSLFKLNKQTYVGGGLLFQHQNGAREIIINGNLEYTLLTEALKDVTLIFSPAWRWADAIIITTGFAYKNWRVGFNYDINASSLVPASRNRGGFEISIIYIDRWLTSENRLPLVVPCPRI